MCANIAINISKTLIRPTIVKHQHIFFREQ